MSGATFLEAAVAYAEAGMAVFPLQPRDKQPFGYTTGKDAASPDPALAERRWQGRAPLPLRPKKTPDERMPAAVMANLRANIGIATGEVSGFWVLDIDGPEGAEALAELETRFGALPVTAEQSTGKGRHICFAWPADRVVKNSASKIGKCVDTRGNGGYIVAAPSIHPSGRVYAWAEGLSPWHAGFVDAPEWLLDLVAPIEAETPAPAAPKPLAPRVRDGRASPYGEKALDNATREIAGLAPGSQNQGFYEAACGIGRLVGGGEIESAYAHSALVAAGEAMHASGKPWTRKQLDDMVDRAFAWGAANPKSAPERAGSARASVGGVRRGSAPAAEKAAAATEAGRLWAEGGDAWCAASSAWLSARGLERRPDANESLIESLRFHPDAPWGRGRKGPALLAPLLDRPIAVDSVREIDGVAVLPLHPECERFTHFVGESEGRVVLLASIGVSLLVTIDLQDAWALAQAGHDGLIAVAPRLSTFAGGALGDTFGRVNPDLPRADPNKPAWTMDGPPKVLLAVRRDLRSPALRVRGPGGRSREVRVEGEAAARFFGSLAEQHWRRARPDLVANAVRLIGPRGGAGFNDFQVKGEG